MEHEIKNDGRTNMRIKIYPGMLNVGILYLGQIYGIPVVLLFYYLILI